MSDAKGFQNAPYEKGTATRTKVRNASRVKPNATDVFALTFESEPKRTAFPLELRDSIATLCREYIELANPFLEMDLPMYAITDTNSKLSSLADAVDNKGYKMIVKRGDGNTPFHFFPQRSVGTINIKRK